MHFRRFDNPLYHAVVPWLHRCNEKYLLQQRDIALACLIAHIDAPAQLRVVCQLSGMFRKKFDKFRKFRQLLNLSDIPEITGQHRREIGRRPTPPSPFTCPVDRFWKPSKQNGIEQIIAKDRSPIPPQFPGEQTIQKGRRSACDLRTSQRPKFGVSPFVRQDYRKPSATSAHSPIRSGESGLAGNPHPRTS